MTINHVPGLRLLAQHRTSEGRHHSYNRPYLSLEEISSLPTLRRLAPGGSPRARHVVDDCNELHQRAVPARPGTPGTRDLDALRLRSGCRSSSTRRSLASFRFGSTCAETEDVARIRALSQRCPGWETPSHAGRTYSHPCAKSQLLREAALHDHHVHPIGPRRVKNC